MRRYSRERDTARSAVTVKRQRRTCTVLFPFQKSQHTKDHTEAFRHLLENVEVVLLENKQDIFSAYKKALEREDGKSTLLVEYGEYYNQ